LYVCINKFNLLFVNEIKLNIMNTTFCVQWHRETTK